MSFCLSDVNFFAVYTVNLINYIRIQFVIMYIFLLLYVYTKNKYIRKFCGYAVTRVKYTNK